MTCSKRRVSLGVLLFVTFHLYGVRLFMAALVIFSCYSLSKIVPDRSSIHK